MTPEEQTVKPDDPQSSPETPAAGAAPTGEQLQDLLRQARELADAGKDDEANALYDQIRQLEGSLE